MSSVNLSSTSLKWKNNVVPKMFQHVNNVDCQEVPSITLDYLISKYGIPYYIKIDIEGGELNAIQGLNHCVQLLSIEACLKGADIVVLLTDHREFAKISFNDVAEESIIDTRGLWHTFSNMVKYQKII